MYVQDANSTHISGNMQDSAYRTPDAGMRGGTKCAFMATIHNKPEQVNIFFRQLIRNENNVVYVHIDRKVRADLEPQILIHPRVKIMEESLWIEWGDDSVFRAQLLMLKQAVADGMEYFTFVSGQDLVIKEDINAFIDAHRDEIFEDCEPADDWGRMFLEHTWHPKMMKLYNKKLSFYRILRRLQIEMIRHGLHVHEKQIDREAKGDMQYYHSFFGQSFPRDFALYALEEIEKDYMQEIFFGGMEPVEYFWPTLIYNSEFAARARTRRKSVYSNTFENNHPVILRMKDVKRLDAMPYLFARKFDMAVDEEVVRYYGEKCY